ncbi:FIG01269488: protein, clustered with ribosomal protein L32p [hydrothermal vent metagenome]|uniref:Large ribosomal RNA subunit accumulation protein YceD n=1 Tax=hydrothermal vent metagenome TaxID=652676 RepID=A0A3B0ZB81_9ZZZZ
MSKHTVRLPHEIDPFRLSETRAHLEGEIPLKQFKRLQPLLKVDSGKVSVMLDFDLDEFGVPQVVGQLKTDLALICQRCLERYDIPVEVELKLNWVKSEQDAKKLPLRYEPLLVESIPLKLNDVIEDELLLALPIIAMHELDECNAAKFVTNDKAAEIEKEKPNPFAVLAELKKDH